MAQSHSAESSTQSACQFLHSPEAWVYCPGVVSVYGFRDHPNTTSNLTGHLRIRVMWPGGCHTTSEHLGGWCETAGNLFRSGECVFHADGTLVCSERSWFDVCWCGIWIGQNRRAATVKLCRMVKFPANQTAIVAALDGAEYGEYTAIGAAEAVKLDGHDWWGAAVRERQAVPPHPEASPGARQAGAGRQNQQGETGETATWVARVGDKILNWSCKVCFSSWSCDRLCFRNIFTSRVTSTRWTGSEEREVGSTPPAHTRSVWKMRRAGASKWKRVQMTATSRGCSPTSRRTRRSSRTFRWVASLSCVCTCVYVCVCMRAWLFFQSKLKADNKCAHRVDLSPWGRQRRKFETSAAQLAQPPSLIVCLLGAKQQVWKGNSEDKPLVDNSWWSREGNWPSPFVCGSFQNGQSIQGLMQHDVSNLIIPDGATDIAISTASWVSSVTERGWLSAGVWLGRRFSYNWMCCAFQLRPTPKSSNF